MRILLCQKMWVLFRKIEVCISGRHSLSSSYRRVARWVFSSVKTRPKSRIYALHSRSWYSIFKRDNAFNWVDVGDLELFLTKCAVTWFYFIFNYLNAYYYSLWMWFYDWNQPPYKLYLNIKIYTPILITSGYAPEDNKIYYQGFE